MSSLRVGIVGATGKMGRFTQGLLAHEADLELVCMLGSSDDLASGLTQSGAQVAVDFTAAGLGAQHGLAMLECGVRPLIGTSGVSEDEDAALDALARERGLGGLVVPNFCLGVWLQQRLARDAARFLPAVEIIEEHHATKKDAPSGTAADTANQLARVTGADEIPVHSVRLPGLYSNQTVVFGGHGEVLRIGHVTYGLDAFGPGILAGLRYVAGAEGVARGIGLAFESSAP
jgi:4-hydroxy-tetrahydrodipicolinate reductase